MPDIIVTVTNDAILRVQNDLTVAPSAQLKVEENGQLVHQNKNTASPNAVIVVNRKTAYIQKFDYTYFCSPVANQQLNMITDYLSFPYVTDYDNTGNGGNYALPRFDKYYNFNQVSQLWNNVNETSLMEPSGKGYIVRGPDSFPTSFGQQWRVSFTGEEHAGLQTTPISGAAFTPFVGAATLPAVVPTASAPLYLPCSNTTIASLNLIGNPYPAVLDADSFLTYPDNVSKLGGALLFWTHKTQPDPNAVGNGGANQVINYSNSDYAIYNRTGGIGTSDQYIRPNGKIGVCQGFFAPAIAGGVATFTTAMQDASIAIGNDQFFRTNGTAMVNPVAKSRIWLSLKGGTRYTEALIGYVADSPANGTNQTYAIPASSNSFDKMYDSEVIDTRYVFNTYNSAENLSNRFELYSILDTANPCPRLSIQGRGPFATSDVIPLGFSCPAGTYTIAATGQDGIFAAQRYMLKQTLGTVVTYYDIRSTPFTFTTTARTDDNTSRFALVFVGNQTNLNINYSNICGTTLATLNSTIYVNQIPGATNYYFSVTEVATGITRYVTTTASSFNFNQLSGITNFGTQYNVNVLVSINGGVPQGTQANCIITTPPLPPTTAVYQNNCNLTISNRNVGFFITPLNTIAGTPVTSYRVRISNGTGVVGTLDLALPLNSFSLANTGFTPALNLTPSTTYTIQIAVFWRNAWQNYGAPCTFTTAAGFTRTSNTDVTIFDVKAYPNPFETAFNLEINTSSNQNVLVKTYDMIGRLIDTQEILATEIGIQEIGNQFPAGVYNIVVTQGENVKTLRVIKR